MGFLQSIRAKELDLSALDNTLILDAINKGEMTGSTSWLGSRRVSIIGQEGFASYAKLAEKVHEILGKNIPESFPERLIRFYDIEYVQSLHSGVIRKIINLLANVFLVATFFNYNQSLRDLEKDKTALRRFKAGNLDLPTFVGKKIKINKEEYIELTESEFKKEGFKALLTESRTQRSTLEGQLTESRTQRSTLEGQLTESRARIGELEGQLKELRNQNRTLKSQIAAGDVHKGTLETLKERIKSKDKAILRLAKEKAEFRGTIKQWQEKENTWHAARQRLTDRNQVLEKQLKDE